MIALDSGELKRHAFALDLAREAGALALGHFRQRGALNIKSKGLQDMASQADLETETLIRGALAKAFPEDAFLGEETGMTDFAPGQGIWVVDPIDGTQPFISGLSSWCVSIAFVRGGDLRFGMVFAPERGEMFSGGRGLAATLNDMPVESHPGRSIREGLVAFGYSTRLPPAAFLKPFNRFIERGGMFYRDGSGALNLCYVACGRLVGYAEEQINSWDCLGALALIDSAGLKRSDFLAGDGLTKGARLIAGNPPVYAELEALLAEG